MSDPIVLAVKTSAMPKTLPIVPVKLTSDQANTLFAAILATGILSLPDNITQDKVSGVTLTRNPDGTVNLSGAVLTS